MDELTLLTGRYERRFDLAPDRFSYRGPIRTLSDVVDPQPGDVVLVGDAFDAYIFHGGTWVRFSSAR